MMSDDEIEGAIEAEAIETPNDLPIESAEEAEECLDDLSEATLPMNEALEAVIKYIERIVCNDVSSVIDDLQRKRTKSVYHATLYAQVKFGKAALSLHKEAVEEAVAALNETSVFCNARRKHSSAVYRVMFGEDYNSHTTEQVHAELCYATTLLADSVLTMVQDPSFLSFVQGAFKFRSCYLSFKECITILRQRNWSDEDVKVHFEGGVMLGLGVYNLVVASLPQKVLNLLEFIGFHGDEATGEKLLLQQIELFQGHTAVLCCGAFLVYQSYLQYIFGNGDADLEVIGRTVHKLQEKFPQSALGLYFEGRLFQISGHIDDAIGRLELANKTIDDYIPFDAFFNWDLCYLYAFTGRWKEADDILTRLHEKCSWSDATAIYVRTVCCYMKGVAENNGHTISEETLRSVTETMSEVPLKCKRVAGRTVPIEVFCAMRAKTFAERNRLTLPHYELMYIWGFFNMFAKNSDTLDKTYKVVLDEVTRLKPLHDCDPTYLPDWCLARFMQGMLLRYRKEFDKAEEILKEVIDHGPELNDEIHSAAFAALELALLMVDRGQLEEASDQLKAAKLYRGFPLSIPVSFKVHSAQKKLDKMLKGDSCEEQVHL